jgi:hypothetical protein
MSSRKDDAEKKADRHAKKGFQLRLPPRIRRQLEKLVLRNDSSLTAEITIAVREKLERVELWPASEDLSEPC